MTEAKTWKPRPAPKGKEAEGGYGWPPLKPHDYCFMCPNCLVYVYGDPPPKPCPSCGYMSGK